MKFEMNSIYGKFCAVLELQQEDNKSENKNLI